MAARKTTVTHADGTVSIRKSQSRTYTHAIEEGPAPAAAYAAYLVRQAERSEANAAKLRAAAERGSVVVRSRGFSSPGQYHDHEAILRGTESAKGNAQIYTWCSADGRTQDVVADGKPIVDVRAYLIEYATRYAEEIERGAVKGRAEAAEVLAAGTPVGTYGILRWSLRADLAVKALSEFDYAVQRGHTVRVVPVDA